MNKKEMGLKDYVAKVRVLQLEKIEESLEAGEPVKSLNVSFPIPGTENEARVIFSVPRYAKERYALQVGALRRGTDRFYSNYLQQGEDVQAIRAYLQQESVEAEWVEALQHLSDKVDDFWD